MLMYVYTQKERGEWECIARTLPMSARRKREYSRYGIYQSNIRLNLHKETRLEELNPRNNLWISLQRIENLMFA